MTGKPEVEMVLGDFCLPTNQELLENLGRMTENPGTRGWIISIGFANLCFPFGPGCSILRSAKSLRIAAGQRSRPCLVREK